MCPDNVQMLNTWSSNRFPCRDVTHLPRKRLVIKDPRFDTNYQPLGQKPAKGRLDHRLNVTFDIVLESYWNTIASW